MGGASHLPLNTVDYAAIVTFTVRPRVLRAQMYDEERDAPQCKVTLCRFSCCRVNCRCRRVRARTVSWLGSPIRMSIEIVGPEKFAFQDLACLDLMLRFADDPGLRLIVEPLGGEDALVALGHAQSEWTIEVQVKGSTGEVKPSTIAACLAHFPPHKAIGCLLERLTGDTSRLVLLIMSGRCVDLASPFVVDVDWSGQTHKQGKLTRATTDAVLKGFGRLGPTSTSSLESKRKRHRVEISKTLTSTAWRSAAHRLLILERVSKGVLLNRCNEYLRNRCRIPADRARDVTKLLCDAVAEAKTGRNDVAPVLRAIIERFTVPSLRPTHYVRRGREADWVVSLTNSNALLLSGPPRCGKTDAARYVASEFQVLGYKVRQGSEVEEALRYLLDAEPEDRLFLLDDPLGGLHVEPNVVRTLASLRSLVGRLTQNRKLIVAQSQDQLFVSTNTHRLVDCPIGNNTWNDLGSPELSFLLSVWESMTTGIQITSPVTQAVTGSILKGEVLEVGNLRHLASSIDQLTPDSSSQAIVRKAREDASDLGRELALGNAAMQGLLAALAIGTSSQEPIHVAELAVLTSASESSFPGLSGLLDGGIAVFGPASPPPQFPAYAKVLALEAEILASLDQLERRHFVLRTSAGIAFSHPFYRAAAESVLAHPTEQTALNTLRTLKRALSCLSPKTTRAAARNLEWLFEYLRSTSDHLGTLVEEASAGLRSIFPATRDLCLSFLIRHAEEFGGGQIQLSDWVQSSLWVSLDEMEWHDGEAWIPGGSRSGLDLLEREFTQPPRSAIQEDLTSASLMTSQQLPPERASRLLKFLQFEPESMSPALALRFLGYDETAIRAEAVFIWLATPRSHDGEILLRIFEDAHPRVLLSAYKALVTGWPLLEEDRRQLILDKLVKGAESPSAAVGLLPELIVFDRVEHTGKNPPWILFSRLLAVVLRKLPANSRFDKARLFNSARIAIQHVTSDEMAQIGNAWIDWLEREVKRRLPDDFEFGVGEIIVNGTAKNPQARLGLVHRLLTFNQTAPLLCFVKDLVDSWNLLTSEERKLVTDLLSLDRRDQRWLRAIVITREDVSRELQELILGRPDKLADPADLLVTELPPPLLEAAVSVYCGTPQPLWWLGTQRNGGKFVEILQVLQRAPDHSLFEMALWRALISPEDDYIRDIVIHAGPSHAERMFRYFLRYKVDCTGNWLPKTWSVILRLAPDGQTRELWFDEMARCAPAILDHLSDASMWLTDKADWRSLLSRLGADVKAELLARQLLESSKEQRETTIQELRAVAESGRIQLFGTYDRAKKILKRFDQGFGTIEGPITSAREQTFKQRVALQEEMREENVPPSDWIS